MKTPEQYLSEQMRLLDPDQAHVEHTPEEQMFLKKYFGQDVKEDKKEKPSPEAPPALEEKVVREESKEQEKTRKTADSQERKIFKDQTAERDSQLKELETLQLVSFTIGEQEFTVPINEVQEVIRYMEPTKIPASPEYIEGMVNLRGRVTPLISLDKLLSVKGAEGDNNNFIVICKLGGFQIGLLINEVSTMYRVSQEDIEWNVDSKLGMSGELISGLIREGERIIGILATDRIMEIILRTEEG